MCQDKQNKNSPIHYNVCVCVLPRLHYLKCKLCCEGELVSLKQASVDVIKRREGDTINQCVYTGLYI